MRDRRAEIIDASLRNRPIPTSIVVLVCGDAEWVSVKTLFDDAELEGTPFGECFETRVGSGDVSYSVRFFHSGWGKVDAAAGAQYAVDANAPDVLINLGTCGGFEGEVTVGDILLVQRTVIYDIHERMGDAAEAVGSYTTDIDLSWLAEPYPMRVRPCTMATADADLMPERVEYFKKEYGAMAGDWESGAVARVCAKNGIRYLILRGVSDIVGPNTDEASGNPALYESRAGEIMNKLVESLPLWIGRC